jgi:hypothetical protein
MIRSRLLAATAALAAAFAIGAHAQSDYPSHPITMIVPFPPGGVADITGRPVAEAMGRYLKQTVVVENKAGAAAAWGCSTCRARSRRIHDPHGALVDLDHPGGRQGPRPRSHVPAEPARADRALHGGSHGPRGARGQPLQEREGPGRGGEEISRLDPLRLVGQLRNDARADGDVQRRGQREDAARAVHRRRARRWWRSSAARWRLSRPALRR